MKKVLILEGIYLPRIVSDLLEVRLKGCCQTDTQTLSDKEREIVQIQTSHVPCRVGDATFDRKHQNFLKCKYVH